MNIKEFNQAYDKKLQYVADVGNNRIVANLQQWCPQIERWVDILIPGNFDLIFQPSEVEFENLLLWCDDLKDSKSKKLKSLIDSIYENRYVIIVDTDYGTFTYDASDTEAIGLACLDLLRKHKKSNGLDFPKKPVEPITHYDTLKNDPELYQTCKNNWLHYQCNLAYYNEVTEFNYSFEKALNDRDYKLAKSIFQSGDIDYMRDYNSFKIERAYQPHLSEIFS